MQKVTCLHFPNVIEDGTESATIPIPAIVLVRVLKDDSDYKIRFDLKNRQYLLVGCDSEEEMKELSSNVQKAIADYYGC